MGLGKIVTTGALLLALGAGCASTGQKVGDCLGDRPGASSSMLYERTLEPDTRADLDLESTLDDAISGVVNEDDPRSMEVIRKLYSDGYLAAIDTYDESHVLGLALMAKDSHRQDNSLQAVQHLLELVQYQADHDVVDGHTVKALRMGAQLMGSYDGGIAESLLQASDMARRKVFSDNAQALDGHEVFGDLCSEGRPAVIMVAADWCPACTHAEDSAEFSSLIEKYGRDVDFVKYDIERRDGRRVAEALDAPGVPAFVYLNGDCEVKFAQLGFDPKSIEHAIQTYTP
ncbi:thioredoxin family protein [Candidatus Woesearchaeota archaeon]|jgi:thiol-disulfide isomerase/thioredoxin|nr:thioredoxin family protein [Candidatus Woesearchaeota archaeon]MBT3538094.1 thioredoxin family protein [Candidatus Woesearchaeota archaeon]MBT4697285.1 thioredoxin family protein [Candidatus Woesearchaeota archaeon]MBT4717394.1 thioredoxin family protein [Candidatus Woesearchaeota archaeon]MBT7105763.1 thioredoxin family protein [Candidatus Woesearchaeota archaeon]